MSNMQSPSYSASRRIGFVSTRFSSTDGVSLETRKWAHVLQGMGHSLYYFAGQSDQPNDISFVVPEAHFLHPDVKAIAHISYKSNKRPPEITHRIHKLRGHLKDRLYKFIQKYDVELLVVENALSIPLNIPLGLALAELIAETNMLVIGHHHDFFWERKRFLVNCISDYLEMAFPPRLPSIQHVVINSLAAFEMGKRRGISAIGAELNWLIGLSAALLEWTPAELVRLEEATFPSYVRGLHESGWSGDLELVRLGFASMLAVYIGCAFPGLAAWWCQPANSPFALQQFDLVEEELYVAWLPLFNYSLERADEARALMKKLGYQ